MIKSYFGLTKWAWWAVAVNAALLLMNVWFYTMTQGWFQALVAGFHIGLIVACVITDRVFLDGIRQTEKAIQDITSGLSKR